MICEGGRRGGISMTCVSFLLTLTITGIVMEDAVIVPACRYMGEKGLWGWKRGERKTQETCTGGPHETVCCKYHLFVVEIVLFKFLMKTRDIEK